MAALSKTALTAASLATAMLFGGGVYLFMNFGSIARTVSERVASETLGVDVDIGGVSVNWQQKAVTVSNVRVGNPPGYQGQHAATIETIYLKAHTLSDTLLNFQDVKVAGTQAYLEVRPDATNLTDIKKNVNAKAAAGNQAAQQIKVIIESMRIESLTVNPNVLLFTDQKMAPIKVPDVVLTGIGAKENGVLASEAIGQIWAHVAEEVSQAANEAGYYQGVSPDALDDLGVGQIEVLKEQIKQDIDDLGDNLKKMFDE
jgi:hypothetical protein